MFKKLIMYLKMIQLFIAKKIVNREDYKKEYDTVSATYGKWLGLMAPNTERIIRPDMIKGKQLKILDLACGTGYIASRLVDINPKCDITCVDISQGMLEKAKANLPDSNITFINQDGIEFLKTNTDKYDIIFFGWALSYFNHKTLFNLFDRNLKDDGHVCIITNVSGTLKDIEQIYIDVMSENIEAVNKVMEIKFNLPDGETGLIKWLNESGFAKIESHEGEEIVRYDTPTQLYEWLRQTGALAGSGMIFKEDSGMENKIIEKLKERKFNDGVYEINHKFAYGIFQKSKKGNTL